MDEKWIKFAHTRFGHNYLAVIIQFKRIKAYRCLDLNTKNNGDKIGAWEINWQS